MGLLFRVPFEDKHLYGCLTPLWGVFNRIQRYQLILFEKRLGTLLGWYSKWSFRRFPDFREPRLRQTTCGSGPLGMAFCQNLPAEPIYLAKRILWCGLECGRENQLMGLPKNMIGLFAPLWKDRPTRIWVLVENTDEDILFIYLLDGHFKMTLVPPGALFRKL